MNDTFLKTVLHLSKEDKQPVLKTIKEKFETYLRKWHCYIFQEELKIKWGQVSIKKQAHGQSNLHPQVALEDPNDLYYLSIKIEENICSTSYVIT
ncbi:hypothetical protein [Ferroplasma acidarmanus]|nr:hypothetical protein [Ferroplasma acidarmanus]